MADQPAAGSLPSPVPPSSNGPRRFIVVIAVAILIATGVLIAWMATQKSGAKPTTAAVDCSQLPESGLQRLCYADMAIEQKNPQLCERIDSPLLRGGCLRQVAIARQDRTACDRLATAEEQEYCSDAVAFAQATAATDPSRCQAMTSQSFGAACLAAIAKTQQDPEACLRISGQSTQADCLIGIAVARLDLATCDRMPSGDTTNWKEVCHRRVIAARGDATLCDQYLPADDPTCRFEVAMARQDAVACDLEPDAGFRSTCYLEVATMDLDLTQCEKISANGKDLMIEECTSRIARAQAGLKPCDELAAGPLQDHCYLYQAQAFRIGGFGIPAVCRRINDESLAKRCREITDVDQR